MSIPRAHRSALALPLGILALALVLPGTAIAPGVPMMHWPADGSALDVVGGHDGTLLGGTTFVAGRSGSAFGVAAPGDVVQVANDGALDVQMLPAATVEGWFLSNVVSDAVIVGKHTCGAQSGWFFATAQGAALGDHLIGGFGAGPANVHDGAWHHFAMVKDGASYFEYVDGALVGSDIGPAFGTPDAAPLQIGGIDTGTCAGFQAHQLSGAVDDVRIHDGALTADEIAAIFAGSPAPPVPELPVLALASAGLVAVALVAMLRRR